MNEESISVQEIMELVGMDVRPTVLYCTVLTNDSENGMDYGLIWKMAA